MSGPQNEPVRIRFSRTVEYIETRRRSDNDDEEDGNDSPANNNDNDDRINDDGNVNKFWKIKKSRDPFYHRTKFSFWNITQIVIMSLTIAPIRLVCVILLLVFAGFLSWIGVVGVSESDLTTKPLEGWRRKLQKVVPMVVRSIFFCIGIHRIKVSGKRATRNEAPILVCAPHATIIDTLAIIVSDSVPIAKMDVKNYFIVGTIGRFQQALFVDLSSKNVLKNVRSMIKIRASDRLGDESRPGWRQLLLFPEGTTTNGRCLIKFKTGAFEPGLPVQMVLIRSIDINNLNTLTWTWNQTPKNPLVLLWLTMCQFNTNFELEYLPVYKPNSLERSDQRLYAKNVRATMARHLDVETSDKSVNDIRK